LIIPICSQRMAALLKLKMCVMIKFTSTLYEQLAEALQEIALQSENTLQKAERSHRVAQSTIKELKSFILDYNFGDKEEEILFFKDIKPRFLKERIYYDELFCFEAAKPVGSKEVQIRYHNQSVERIRLFFERNQKLYNYYRLGKEDKDERFFMRTAEFSEGDGEFDSRFCTPYSYKLAKIKAFEQFKNYLLAGINEPEKENSALISETDAGLKLFWTDSKVDFTEWLYGLHSTGSINNGKITAKQLFIAFQNFLNINAGNHYSALQQNIRIRKKRRTTYLDREIECLEKRMDDWDENPRYG